MAFLSRRCCASRGDRNSRRAGARQPVRKLRHETLSERVPSRRFHAWRLRCRCLRRPSRHKRWGALHERRLPCAQRLSSGRAIRACSRAGALPHASLPPRANGLSGALGDAQKLLHHVWISRRDGVVPFWMERIAIYVEGRHLRVGDFNAFWIGVGIEFAANR